MARRLADVVILPTEEALEGPRWMGTPKPVRPRRSRARARGSRPRRRATRRARFSLSPWRMLAGLAALLSFTLLTVMAYAPMFRVETVYVQGLVLVPEQTLAQWPPLLALRDRPVITVDTHALARRMQEAFPVFREVRVWVAFPNRLHLQVQERKPVLVWKEGGQTFWMDAEGVRFYAYGPSNPAWPVVEAGAENIALTREEVTRLLELTRHLPGRRLVYHPRYGFGWKDEGGWPVYLGRSLADLEERLRVYQALRAGMAARGVHPRLVWLLSGRAVVVRLKEAGEP